MESYIATGFLILANIFALCAVIEAIRGMWATSIVWFFSMVLTCAIQLYYGSSTEWEWLIPTVFLIISARAFSSERQTAIIAKLEENSTKIISDPVHEHMDRNIAERNANHTDRNK